MQRGRKKQDGKKESYTKLQLLEARAGVEADPVPLMTSSFQNFGNVTEATAEMALRPKNEEAPVAASRWQRYP